MNLTHYAKDVVELDRSRTYENPPYGHYRHEKPRGLWVSVDGDDDWPSWCWAEGYGLQSLAVRHRVTLTADADVLVLDSPHKLDEFTDEYAVWDQGRPWWPENEWRAINWGRVSDEHDGVIIAPYHSARRYLFWYNGWDCASGCVWNLSAIAEFAPPAGVES